MKRSARNNRSRRPPALIDRQTVEGAYPNALTATHALLAHSHPPCARCGFDLHRQQGDGCPECGLRLQDAVWGRRVSNWWHFWFLCNAMFLGVNGSQVLDSLHWGLPYFQRVDWIIICISVVSILAMFVMLWREHYAQRYFDRRFYVVVGTLWIVALVAEFIFLPRL